TASAITTTPSAVSTESSSAGCVSSDEPAAGAAAAGAGAAGNTRAPVTPQEGSGSAPSSIPGGAPSRCTGSLGTIEPFGRDHGPAARLCAPGSGVPEPPTLLQTR